MRHGVRSALVVLALLVVVVASGGGRAGEPETTGAEKASSGTTGGAGAPAAGAPDARGKGAADAAFAAGLAAFDEANAAGDPQHPGYAKARERWEPLARTGDARAEYHMGVLHLYGLGGAEPNPNRAIDMIRDAAEKGYPQAQSFLGLMSERGTGFYARKDDGEALRWYRKAAEQGHCVSVRRLARALEKGELGLEPDPGEAARWREREATCHRR